MLSTHSVFEQAGPVELADDIEALRKKLGLNRVTLLGHSFGGNVALAYALRYPDRVKRLILAGTSGVVESQAEVEKRIAKSLNGTEAASFYSGEGGTGKQSPCERTRSRYRALYPHYFHKVPDAGSLDRGVYSIYFDALARKQVLAADSGGFDLRQHLGKIQVPVLIFAGRHDEVTPLVHGSDLAANLRHSRLVVMEQSGHFPFLEENYLFTQWVHRFVIATADLKSDWVTSAPVNASTIRMPGAANSRY
jgi:proline iminopeptidase